MAISLKHAFTSPKADGTDSTLVQPSNWNAEHTITLAAGKVLGRDSSGNGAAQELAISVDSTQQSMIPPSGTTAQRPGTPAAGMMRYNTTTGKFEGYTSTWGTLGGGCAISDTAPSNPSSGDLWWKSDEGQMYVYYNDGSSSQWVIANAFIGTGVYLPLAGGTVTGATTFNAKPTIYSNDAGSTGTPLTLEMFRDSASPADQDLGGRLLFTGRNSAGTKIELGSIYGGLFTASTGRGKIFIAPTATGVEQTDFGLSIDSGGGWWTSVSGSGTYLGLSPAAGSTGASGQEFYSYTATAGSTNYLGFLRARGVESTPTGVQTNDQLGNIYFSGHNGTGFLTGASIAIVAAEVWSSTVRGTYMRFLTVPAGTNTQSERFRINSNGDALARNGAAIGYDTTSGGTVTQATSKSTAVTLNAPTGQITMNGAALAANTTVNFSFTNSSINAGDVVLVNVAGGFGANYLAWPVNPGAGGCNIALRNISGGSLSEAVVINFVVIKGATA